ncbi:CRISPR-associated protein [Campylobacter fetus]|nr:CRISPR-associated protein [Campylobacter fetus]
MNLNYQLKFYDYWHLSSGLSGGAKFNSIVIKDSNRLPFAPGKTIKGLLREMANLIDRNFTKICFGDKECAGSCYFSNAILEQQEAGYIIANSLQPYLYDIIAQTSIDDNGNAKDDSLRVIEVVIPLKLQGEIRDIPDEFECKMRKSLSMIKQIGLNRNRGLGRCEFCIEEQK